MENFSEILDSVDEKAEKLKVQDNEPIVPLNLLETQNTLKKLKNYKASAKYAIIVALLEASVTGNHATNQNKRLA